MSEGKKGYGKVLKVFRLETEASVSVSDLGIQVQSVRADIIPLSSESLLRSAFESAGLTPEQVEDTLQKLTRTAKNEGFLIPIDQNGPNKTTDAPTVGELCSQAAVFVYKNDTSVRFAEADIRAMNKSEGGISGEIHGDKQAFISALRTWNSGIDPTNAFLCIYSHAGAPGITPIDELPDKSPIISWTELADALPQGVQYLWLLGCETEKSIKAWKTLAGPVRHRLLATDSSMYWEPFLKFFAHEISIDPIICDDEIRALLIEKSPELASHTKYFGPDLRPIDQNQPTRWNLKNVLGWIEQLGKCPAGAVGEGVHEWLASKLSPDDLKKDMRR